ncbi:MAG: hypothetical protein FWG09_01325 [Synergistaceae bacterium]|nr:hypothetical protein [Synergistaceae bacterium]
MQEIQPLSLLITICDRGKGKNISELFSDRSAAFNLMMLGMGTASSKILNYLGLGQSEKVILLSVMPVAEARELLVQIDLTLELKKPGHGIAFTLPLNGAYAKNLVKVLAEPGMEEGKMQTSEYELIITVANRGYNQEVMDAARTAKATGGTIINGKGFSLSGAEKFFGVTLQSEKEVILILAQSDRKNEIMKAISEKAGLDTQAGAVSFSMAVSGVEGLQPYLEQIGDSD